MTKKSYTQQKVICKRYGANFTESPPNLKVGISDNVKEGVQPIHGLRHREEGDTTGWYIWAGEWSNEEDFFKPLHVMHLLEDEYYHIVLQYLGLAPGWRFLIDNNGHEEVWYDSKLLED